ncbi:MAG TPA: molybdopterin-dependent oxidoreductase [Acidimicrobiales bacterium]|jgi:DMSO/TMAO reductase YedYZ molybdopterin-dependent catalytic subunit|nr:molybdopterin-dependent oxidoreductase [Acidimicrobiales bacterium]
MGGEATEPAEGPGAGSPGARLQLRRIVGRYGTDPDQPLRQGPYQSPLRDERLAAWLGATLGVLFTVCFVTGMFSHLQQHPLSWLPVPARPAGLFRITQGIHVAAGIASMPVLAAKLWIVWPRLLTSPPFRRLSQLVERIGVLALVAGGIFMVFSGIANIAQWYPWPFAFPAAHYWVAWIVMGAIVAHIGAKWATTREALRRPSRRPALAEADPALSTLAEGRHVGLSRRGLLTTVAVAAGALTVTTIGQTIDPLRRLALLAPRDPSVGPQGRPVNRSAANAKVVGAATSDSYRFRVEGHVTRPLTFTMAQLLAFPAHEATLPIACVEGWSYTAVWRGVRVRDLLNSAGAPPDATAHVESLEANSPYRISFLDRSQAHDQDTLLATHLDGQPLDLDHGFPLRLIGPDRAGVTQTKWITRLTVD